MGQYRFRFKANEAGLDTAGRGLDEPLGKAQGAVDAGAAAADQQGKILSSLGLFDKYTVLMKLFSPHH